MGAAMEVPVPTLGPPPPDLLRGASLFLDFDGTLVELAATPDAVRVAEAVPEVLAALARLLDGRIAIVSGRSLAQIGDYLGTDLAMSGSHGLEVAWTDGRTAAPEAPGWLPDAIEQAEALARRHPGMVVEKKPFGLALHYRGAPGAQEDCRVLAAALAGDDRIVQAGKMVFEIRPAGADKGEAVRRFMADPAFRAGRPIFVGDDVTDEAGFAAARALGGTAILVGPARATAAAYRLDDVAATLDWLAAAARDVQVPA